jgi:predicted amidophosphoribosyltransferase
MKNEICPFCKSTQIVTMTDCKYAFCEHCGNTFPRLEKFINQKLTPKNKYIQQVKECINNNGVEETWRRIEHFGDYKVRIAYRLWFFEELKKRGWTNFIL